MGYSPVAVVVYGVDVPALKQERLYKVFSNAALRALRSCQDKVVAEEWATGTADEAVSDSVYPVNDAELIKRGGRHVCNVAMLAYGGDARLGERIYRECGQHCFGVFLGSTGYGWFDDVARIVKNVPYRAKSNWRKYCVPLLKQACIAPTRPKCVIVPQIW